MRLKLKENDVSIETTSKYEISKLDDNTFLVWDKSKSVPTPHYYKTLKAAQNKCKKIK